MVVYVKKNELALGIEGNLLSLVEEARLCASKTGCDPSKWEVAVSIVEAHCEDEPYPINYLRNVALLQAPGTQSVHRNRMHSGKDRRTTRRRRFLS